MSVHFFSYLPLRQKLFQGVFVLMDGLVCTVQDAQPIVNRVRMLNYVVTVHALHNITMLDINVFAIK